MFAAGDIDSVRREVMAEIKAETGYDLDSHMAAAPPRRLPTMDPAELAQIHRKLRAEIAAETGHDIGAPQRA